LALPSQNLKYNKQTSFSGSSGSQHPQGSVLATIKYQDPAIGLGYLSHRINSKALRKLAEDYMHSKEYSLQVSDTIHFSFTCSHIRQELKIQIRLVSAKPRWRSNLCREMRLV